MMKTKYGEEINPDDFPYFGQFGVYVRKNIDSEWGKDKEREITKTKTYEVLLSASVGRTAYATLRVDAESAEEAEETAKENVSKFDWKFDELEDVDDISVESVEECNSDE